MIKKEKFWKQQIEIIKEESRLEDLGGEDPSIETEKNRDRLCGAGRYGSNAIGYSQVDRPEII